MTPAAWTSFWTIWLVIAGTSFALITVVVTVLGLRDLKTLFRVLRHDKGHDQ